MLTALEAEYFRALNRIVEPMVLAGCGSPGVIPIGLIVLETKGWRTGQWHRTPIVAAAIGNYLLVSTVRGRRSHWVKNLSQTAEIRYWRGAQLRRGRAIVFAPNGEMPDVEMLPPPLVFLGISFAWLASDLGCAFALLTPEAA